MVQEKPKKLTKAEMAKVRVEYDGNPSHIRLICMQCKQTWSPNIQPGGRLPNRYWQCPNGCNK